MEQYPLVNNYAGINQADSNYRFAAGVAMFGMLLKKSEHIKEGGWEELIRMLQTCVNKNDYWQNEMLMLVQKAKDIYKPARNRKGLFKRKKSGE
jgi:Ca-activated chloride channel family protein